MTPRRSAQPPPPRDVRQFRSTTDIDNAIRKLRARIADIKQLQIEAVSHSDARVQNVQHAIRDTIREEFGADSAEYERHRYFKINDGPATARIDFMGSGRNWDALDEQEFAERLPGAITRIEGLIDRLTEKRADFAEPAAVSRVAFSGAALHPAIASAAQRLFEDGHHPQAVFEAGKALVGLVKAKAGRFDLDGVPMMQQVFSVNSPVLAFNDRADQSDRDEQQGLMYLYTGAVLAIRNPGGHRVGAVEDPARALQHLQLLSYLAERLDTAKKP